MTKNQKAILRSMVEELIMESHPELLDDDLADAFQDYRYTTDAKDKIIEYLEGME